MSDPVGQRRTRSRRDASDTTVTQWVGGMEFKSGLEAFTGGAQVFVAQVNPDRLNVLQHVRGNGVPAFTTAKVEEPVTSIKPQVVEVNCLHRHYGFLIIL